jgi:hypothetical protein
MWPDFRLHQQQQDHRGHVVARAVPKIGRTVEQIQTSAVSIASFATF